MTRLDPACRRTLARLRLRRMQLRRAGMLTIAGYNPPHGANVQETWKRYGWVPRAVFPVTTIEYRNAV